MVSDIIKNIAVVGAGSFIGGAVRYLTSLAMKGFGKGFPWATLAVNLVGCLLIGLLWGIFSRTSSEGGNVWGFAGYVAISVVVGIALVAAGYYLVR